MKIILFVFFLAFYNLSFAQPEKEVETAVEKLRLAMIDPSEVALKNLTSKDLTYGHSSGLIENQSQFIEALVTGKTDFKTISLSDQSVVVTGKNVALVRQKLKGELMAAGNTNMLNLSVLLVWMKEKGEWKLIARQAVKL